MDYEKSQSKQRTSQRDFLNYLQKKKEDVIEFQWSNLNIFNSQLENR